MDTITDRVRGIVEPIVDRRGLELVDVEQGRGLLRITVDRDGGIDLDAITEVSRAISDVLDEHDPLPGGRYTLEVTSPGLERPLKKPDHFRRFVGTLVTVRTRAGVEGERRTTGVLEEADDKGVVVAGRRIAFDDIDRARTVFEWGPAERPARGKRQRRGKARRGEEAEAAAGRDRPASSEATGDER